MVRGPRTAVRGNLVAAAGMGVALVATLLDERIGDWGLIAAGVAVGTAIGVPSARSVKMTAMPQMVALFNGVGGGAVALISLVEFREAGGDLPLESLIPILFAADRRLHLVLGLQRGLREAAGAGDHAAPLPVAHRCSTRRWRWSRWASRSSSRPGRSPRRCSGRCWSRRGSSASPRVLPIGGADMPVVISTLNAFTGLSAAAAGVALDNTALIVAGMLVGASGSILTRQMAEAMNRSIGNVFFGGFGAAAGTVAGDDGVERTVRSTSAADVAIQLSYARLVVVVPGYGMAVAQAQRTVADLAAELEKRGVEVLYAIHPVAGRMPGHMNVLLAEADVPYAQLKEMDEINGEFARTDVALVIGANDVINPSARSATDSPIYGMPILDVDKAHSVVVLKRSMASGFAGIDNPLFYDAQDRRCCSATRRPRWATCSPSCTTSESARRLELDAPRAARDPAGPRRRAR